MDDRTEIVAREIGNLFYQNETNARQSARVILEVLDAAREASAPIRNVATDVDVQFIMGKNNELLVENAQLRERDNLNLAVAKASEQYWMEQALEQDENTLPMSELPEGWVFAGLQLMIGAVPEKRFEVLMATPKYRKLKTAYGYGPTPRAAMLAAIGKAREAGG